MAALSQTSATSIEYAIIGGVIFNVANLLLVAAIDIAGLAVAFPVGIGVALVVGAVSSYLISPAGNRVLLFGGIAFVVAAILFDAAAYRLRDTDKTAMSKRGVIISVVSGLLMGSFYPFVAKAMGAANGSGALLYGILLRSRSGSMRGAIQLSAHAQAPRRPRAGRDARLLERKPKLASLGNIRRRHLVYRRGAQLRRLAQPNRRPGSLILYRAGSNHDLRLLGSLRMAGVQPRSAPSEDISCHHVSLLSNRSDSRGPRADSVAKTRFAWGGFGVSNKKPIVVVGSINADLVATVPHIPLIGETITGTTFQIHPGGKGANQAVAVARLGYPVKMIGRLGTDVYGQQLRSHLQTESVNTDAVMTTEGSSGIALILVSQAGENCIVVIPGSNAFVSPADIDANIATIREAGMVLAQLEIPIETVSHLAEVCTREGIPLMLDPAPAVSLPRDLLRHVVWFTPNETESAFFVQELAPASHPGDPGRNRTNPKRRRPPGCRPETWFTRRIDA